jgi:hypothetical protein
MKKICSHCQQPIEEPSVYKVRHGASLTYEHAHWDTCLQLLKMELKKAQDKPQTVTEEVLQLVAGERLSQDAKWGRKPGGWSDVPLLKLAVLSEEHGEVARALLEKSPRDHLKKELIQVAAVAVAWVEQIVCDEGCPF